MGEREITSPFIDAARLSSFSHGWDDVGNGNANIYTEILFPFNPADDYSEEHFEQLGCGYSSMTFSSRIWAFSIHPYCLSPIHKTLASHSKSYHREAIAHVAILGSEWYLSSLTDGRGGNVDSPQMDIALAAWWREEEETIASNRQLL